MTQTTKTAVTPITMPTSKISAITKEKASGLENYYELPSRSFLTCKGEAPMKLQAPENNVVYVEKLVVGVTRDGSCDASDPDYCNSDAVITCSLKGSETGLK